MFFILKVNKASRNYHTPNVLKLRFITVQACVSWLFRPMFIKKGNSIGLLGSRPMSIDVV